MQTEQNPNRSGAGAVLRAVREAAGISRRSLAETAGIDHSHLSRVETGERALTPELAQKVSEALVSHLTGRPA